MVMATAGAAWLATTSAGAAAAGPLGLPVGLELYPLNEALAKDFEGTLHKVAEIGYREVELPSFYGRTPTQLRTALSASGLGCISAGVLPNPLAPGMPSLETDADRIFDGLNHLGVTYAVCLLPPIPQAMRTPQALQQPDPYTLMFSRFSAPTWREAADFLNRAGARAKRHGLQLAYHNHDMEFVRRDGPLGYDILLEATDPALVKFEMDCAFVAARGYDPAHYLRKHPTRIALLHIKDIERRVPVGTDPQSVAVGAGVIDWPAVFTAAKAAGIRRYYVEMDPPFRQPVLQSLRESFDYLQALKV
jgi:sugar phosphate isomerase/epimerase